MVSLRDMILISAKRLLYYSLFNIHHSLFTNKDTKNYIYDLRSAVSDEQEYSGAVHSLVDLEIGGKGRFWWLGLEIAPLQ